MIGSNEIRGATVFRGTQWITGLKVKQFLPKAEASQHILTVTKTGTPSVKPHPPTAFQVSSIVQGLAMVHFQTPYCSFAKEWRC
jgi:hypothetical protein